MFVSSPVDAISGALPVAALVMSIWFTAELVFWKIINSLPLSSWIPCASSNLMFCELVSKSPPNCGVVSSTTLDI